MTTLAVPAVVPQEQAQQTLDLLTLVQNGQVQATPQGVLYLMAGGEPLAPQLQRLMVTLTGAGLISDPPGAASAGWVPAITDAGTAWIASAPPGVRAVIRADGLYCSVHGILLAMPADGTLNLTRADRVWSTHLGAVHADRAPARLPVVSG